MAEGIFVPWQVLSTIQDTPFLGTSLRQETHHGCTKNKSLVMGPNSEARLLATVSHLSQPQLSQLLGKPARVSQYVFLCLTIGCSWSDPRGHVAPGTSQPFTCPCLGRRGGKEAAPRQAWVQSLKWGSQPRALAPKWGSCSHAPLQSKHQL